MRQLNNIVFLDYHSLITVKESLNILRRIPEKLIPPSLLLNVTGCNSLGEAGVTFCNSLATVESLGLDIREAPEEWGDDWKGFLLNYTSDTLFIWRGYADLGSVRGAVTGHGISVVALPGECSDEIRLRVWHELLHYYDKPADGLEYHLSSIMGPLEERYIYPRLSRFPFGRRWYERRYYEYLTAEVDE